MITPAIKIVLIEDDLNLGSSILEFLVLAGFDVHWFKNGIEALDYLQNNIPDIIISDLMLPLMSGEELFLEIRKSNKFNTIPFIMITANGNEEVRYKQLEIGVNDYIMKPFKVKEMIFKINNILALKKQIENKFTPDPFSKVTIKLSEKDFMLSLNSILAENIRSKIEIVEIANLLHVSKSTLDKKIRKRTNKNISQYIREFKLEYAIKLINLGERNIQFLADQTGFNSISYFSTSFKNYKTESPSDYIKSL
ncbi:response regulator transcription factor [Flavobacterium sp. W22_SRS_FP1]|uniref:response regulator transcription factor n=1 Tax=Flavobacterium sp. W22_SRS_FP1 TaxID=3240276 RepID=UPI003F926226